MEQTLLIIKPDAVEDGHIGEIISHMEKKGIKIINMKMETFSRKRAEGFYAIHRGKPFFINLVEFMVSGPIIAMELESENCIKYVREIIGLTNPEEAAEGTVRKLYARGLTQNAVHASDSAENAKKEISFFFDKK